ncbi:MAG: hypothetical protein IJS09_04915, partial [Treponema sp.]|nr:hypothetical protein [Treponema sp.]
GGVYRPVMQEWPDFYAVLGKEMQSIINGEKSVNDGLTDAQIQLEGMLNQQRQRTTIRSFKKQN